MKKIVLILVALLIGYSASAQVQKPIEPGMKYKEIKEYYNYKDYTKGPDQYYRPIGLGVASLLVPGLGEMISGEVWRGTAFLGGWIASHFVTLTGIAELSDAIYWTGIAGALAMRVISCMDAIKVAKVKDMYKRDLAKTYSYDVDLYPSMNYIKTSGGVQPTAGLTLAVRF